MSQVRHSLHCYLSAEANNKIKEITVERGVSKSALIDALLQNGNIPSKVVAEARRIDEQRRSRKPTPNG